MTNPFDPTDFTSWLSQPHKATARKPARPLPQIRGRREDGVLWVRAEDVADALASQAPTVNARLIDKLRGK